MFPIGDESLVLNPEADDIPVLELISPSEKKILKNLKSSKRQVSTVFNKTCVLDGAHQAGPGSGPTKMSIELHPRSLRFHGVDRC